MPLEGQSISEAPRAANAELLQRLRSANGHLHAVIAMIEAGEPCEAVLHQLGAVHAALMAARCSLILCQVQQSASSLLSDSCPETRAETVQRLSNLYSLFARTRLSKQDPIAREVME